MTEQNGKQGGEGSDTQKEKRAADRNEVKNRASRAKQNAKLLYGKEHGKETADHEEQLVGGIHLYRKIGVGIPKRKEKEQDQADSR